MQLLHYSSKKIAKLKSVQQSSSPQPKPRGFWYSCGKSWEEWAESEDFQYGKEYIYEVELDYSRILRIKNARELLKFTNDFGVGEFTEIKVPDWKKVAELYDGIEICPSIGSQHLSLFWYYPWDVASGCVWNSRAIKSLTLIGGTAMKKDNLNEGLTDLIKKAVASLKQGATKGWEKVQGVLRSSVANMTGIIQRKVAELSELKPQLQFVMDIKNEAETETGEKFPMDNTMQVAQNLSQTANAAMQEVNGLKNQVQTAVNQGQQVQPNQRGVQEAVAIELANILNETAAEYKAEQAIQPLNEALGVTTVIGLILGAMGGIPLLLKGLYKFTKFVGLEKVSHSIEHAYHVAHKIEAKGIDIIIPDRLSYVIYKRAWAKGFKTSRVFLQFEDYSANKQHAKQKVEALMYKLILVYFAAEGIAGVLRASSAALATAEGAASTVKAIEIATGIVDAAAIVKKV